MDLRDEAKKKENSWFHHRERKLLDELRAKRLMKMKEATEKAEAKRREELKALHWMRCPKCGHAMEEKEHLRIKVDVCTFCEGIYLDRGEMEELVFRGQEERQGFIRRLLGLKGD